MNSSPTFHVQDIWIQEFGINDIVTKHAMYDDLNAIPMYVEEISYPSSYYFGGKVSTQIRKERFDRIGPPYKTTLFELKSFTMGELVHGPSFRSMIQIST
jgi:hypothetical protein